MNRAFATELSPAGYTDLAYELSEMDPKSAIGWFRALAYFARWGSMPADQKSVCAILGVTPRHMRERAWPMIENRLELSDDERRYFLPRSANDGRGRMAPPPQAPKSSRHVKAARTRWGNENVPGNDDTPKTGPEMHPDASEDASPLHENGCNGDAKTPAKSTTDAYGFASPDASVASDASRTLSPSLASASLSEDLEESTPSESEGERAGASASGGADATVDATDASGHAKPDATGDAKPDATKLPNPPAKLHLLPHDWTPPADITDEIAEAGDDPAKIAAMFVAYHRARASKFSDWREAYRAWWMRQPSFDPPVNREMPLMRNIPGGGQAKADPAKQAADAEAEAVETAACTGAGTGPTFARAVRSLKKDMPAAEHRTLFSKIRFGRLEGDEAVILGDSQWVCDHVRTTFGDRLRDGIRRDYPAIKRLAFEVASAERRQA